MKRKTNALLACLIVVCACKQQPLPTEQKPASAQTFTAAMSAPPPPAAVVVDAPVLKTAAWALFDGDKVITCSEMTGPAEKIDALEIPKGGTRLKQSCDSLGRTELTSCTYPDGKAVLKFYTAKYADKQLPDCVKAGGTWATNKSPQAQMERAEQDLAAAKAAAGM